MRISKSADWRNSSSVLREIAFGLGVDEGEHVDGLARADDVDLRRVTGFGGSAELNERLHVKRLDEALKAHRLQRLAAEVLGAQGGVEAFNGGSVGAGCLVDLLGGERRQVVFAYGPLVSFLCGLRT